MRSYYEHLESASGIAKGLKVKPAFRSSSIFPVMEEEGISSRILFMGYWVLKRHIRQITAVATLRNSRGELLHRLSFSIEEPKTYRLEAAEFLRASEYSGGFPFFGTLEVEFFSAIPLVFPFPATVINYYGPHFSSVVHTAQRVYNDFEDMQNNSKVAVAESGFNIYADRGQEPFFGIINGPETVEDFPLEMLFYNHQGETVNHIVSLGKQLPYQLNMVYPARQFDLFEFLQGEAGAVKLKFRSSWIFPRLLVGNLQHTPPAVTITHTYYDCSEATSQSDYWLSPQKEWHSASLMLPLSITDDLFTNIYFYPIYSPSNFFIDIELYAPSGKCLERYPHLLSISSPSEKVARLILKEIAASIPSSLNKAELAIRIIASPSGDHPIPARIKLGLDIGHTSLPHMPCNICTNLQPFNPAWENKPSTFRWFPVLADQSSSSCWIMNSSPAVNYQKNAIIQLTFFREKDATTLKRTLTLPPHGFTVIQPEIDQELTSFLEKGIGWCTAISDNPYTTTYYFADSAQGIFGGDHGF